MQYTLRQMRETVGLSLETYRHWKRVLPTIAGKSGRSPCFSIGDLVAASVIQRLTDTAGVRVGHLKDVSVGIFELCNGASWAALENAVLAIDLELRTCQVRRSTPSSNAGGLTLLCALDPVLDELRAALWQRQIGQDQAELRFPPTQIGNSPERSQDRA